MDVRSPDLRRLAQTFVIELVIYGLLLAAYFLTVLRFLGQPLTRLFDGNLTLYGIAALGLIVAQGVVLEVITSFLVRLLGLASFE